MKDRYKGVVLAGGLGTRLGNLVRVSNKHILPCYDRPLIFHPIETLQSEGITSLLLITGGNHLGAFMDLLGDGHSLGVDLTYKIQENPDGIAGALKLAEDFVGGNPFTVILSDNIFGSSPDLRAFYKKYYDVTVRPFGPNTNTMCKIFLKEVEDPERFGVAQFNESGKIIDIIEKPINPPSNYAVVGLYQYSPNIFHILRELKLSSRNEFEISHLHKALLEGDFDYNILHNTYWQDAGTIDSLFEASKYFYNYAHNI